MQKKVRDHYRFYYSQWQEYDVYLKQEDAELDDLLEKKLQQGGEQTTAEQQKKAEPQVSATKQPADSNTPLLNIPLLSPSKKVGDQLQKLNQLMALKKQLGIPVDVSEGARSAQDSGLSANYQPKLVQNINLKQALIQMQAPLIKAQPLQPVKADTGKQPSTRKGGDAGSDTNLMSPTKPGLHEAGLAAEKARGKIQGGLEAKVEAQKEQSTADSPVVAGRSNAAN